MEIIDEFWSHGNEKFSDNTGKVEKHPEIFYIA